MFFFFIYRPGADVRKVVENLEKEKKKLEEAVQADMKQVIKKEIDRFEDAIKQSKEREKESKIEFIRILKRFHFEPSLQRMSVFCEVKEKTGKSYYAVLLKGSPEAVGHFIVPPSDYESNYTTMAKKGMRVLAMAMKTVPKVERVEKYSREEAEKDMKFLGFVSFECKIRSDSPPVVGSLMEAGMKCIMVTGDSSLTALHVARACKFINKEREVFQLSKNGKQLESIENKEKVIALQLSSFDGGLSSAKGSDKELICTEEALERLSLESEGRCWFGVSNFAILARMSPRGKAKCIRSIQTKIKDKKNENNFVLMCGDGGNDVGALKQSDVGLALLSGYGSANTKEIVEEEEQQQDKVASEQLLNVHLEKEKKRMDDYVKQRTAHLELKKKEFLLDQQKWLQEEMEKIPPEQRGVMSSVTAMKNVGLRLRNELQREQEKMDKKFGLATSASTSDEELLAKETELNLIRPGDASVAGSFTFFFFFKARNMTDDIYFCSIFHFPYSKCS